jgi:hypothetical protein
VFHAWDAAFTARRMFLAPLAWTADGPRVTTYRVAANRAPRVERP